MVQEIRLIRMALIWSVGAAIIILTVGFHSVRLTQAGFQADFQNTAQSASATLKAIVQAAVPQQNPTQFRRFADGLRQRAPAILAAFLLENGKPLAASPAETRLPAAIGNSIHLLRESPRAYFLVRPDANSVVLVQPAADRLAALYQVDMRHILQSPNFRLTTWVATSGTQEPISNTMVRTPSVWNFSDTATLTIDGLEFQLYGVHPISASDLHWALLVVGLLCWTSAVLIVPRMLQRHAGLLNAELQQILNNEENRRQESEVSQDRLRQENARLVFRAMIVDLISDPVAVSRPSGELVYRNDAWVARFGANPVVGFMDPEHLPYEPLVEFTTYPDRLAVRCRRHERGEYAGIRIGECLIWFINSQKEST